MKGTPERTPQPQQWSVHAEFTISHPGAGDPKNPPKTGTIQDDKGIRMLYSWSANDGRVVSHVVPQPISSNVANQRPPPFEEGNRLYGFQRGNLFFTSTPPRRHPITNPGYISIPDSGYGSDLLSPNSQGGSLPRRIVDPYHRKCRSTCNIILGTSGNEQNVLPRVDPRSTCGRTQSLRCQTPSVCNDGKSDTFYGCGDPWCHHLHASDELSASRRISPVKEVCEETRPDCTCAVCDPEYRNFGQALKRDVSVQTYDMVNKCTSPMMKIEDSNKNLTVPRKNSSKLKRGKTIGPSESRSQSMKRPLHKTGSVENSQQSLPKLSRSPTLKDLPSLPTEQKKSSSSETKPSDSSSKKPRTIHIDVYCTGTDLEADSSTSSSDSEHSKTPSTPQTVFESDKLHVTHKKADNTIVPYNFRQQFLEGVSKINTSTSVDKDDSDCDDDDSTAYPSKLSSYSHLGYSLSSMSSFPNSATPYSMSSCTVPDGDADSIANTSWKDTFSDIDSLLQSRSSVAPNDSLYFIPKKIEEETESLNESSKNITGTTNSLNLQGSDSFEYANSEDRLRIKRMEKLWMNKSQWRHAPIRRKLFSQQKQLQETVNKRLSQIDVSKDSDSDASDESEKGWTFVKTQEAKIAESSTNQQITDNSRIANPVKVSNVSMTAKKFESNNQPIGADTKHSKSPETQIDNTASDKVSDTSSCPSKSPVSIILRQRLTDPNLRSPFSNSLGQFTQQRQIANRFGPMVDVLRKPGHHVGPVRNPDCSCFHCRYHFENVAFRNRTASVGDTYRSPIENQEDMNPIRRSTSEHQSFDNSYTDF